MGTRTRPSRKDTSTVALFRPYERSQKTSSADHISTLTPKGEKAAAKSSTAPAPTVEQSTPAAAPKQVVRKKEGATPTRRAAEAARSNRSGRLPGTNSQVTAVAPVMPARGDA